jgi:CheY-like chemotaxis protein
MDGVSAMRCIRQTRKSGNARVVAVTALASDDHRRQFQSEGFVAYLPKPVEMNALRIVLQELLFGMTGEGTVFPPEQSAAKG